MDKRHEHTRVCWGLLYLHDFRVTYVQRLGASTVQILHDQLKHTTGSCSDVEFLKRLTRITMTKQEPYMEYVVLDVTDLNTGVLCSRAVLEQRLEPEWSSKGLWACFIVL